MNRLLAINVVIAIVKPAAVEISASLIPAITFVLLSLIACSVRPLMERISPKTVPKRPIKGAIEIIVPRVFSYRLSSGSKISKFKSHESLSSIRSLGEGIVVF